MSYHPNLSEILHNPDRLAKLHALCLLDTLIDAAFDRLTRLATQILNTPISLVTLVDADRQVFKSQVGLPEPWATTGETPLSHSFCQHTMALSKPLVIEDARLDALVANNLGIRDLGVIAYLGIPLLTADGHRLGSFCVIDTQPRQWSEAEITLMEDLTVFVMTEIELRGELLENEKLTLALRTSDQRYHQIFDGIDDLIVVEDLTSGSLWANRAFCDYHGLNLETLQASSAPLSLDITTTSKDQPDQLSLEELLTHHDRQVRLFHTIKTPIYNDQGEIIMRVAVSRDVTERKQLETDLQLALTREAKLNQLQSHFTIMASHEFRTPLAIILSSNGILKRYPHKLSSEKKRYYLEQVEQQVHRLTALLEDMLAFNTSLIPKVEQIDLVAICQDIISEIQITTDKHQIVSQTIGVHVLFACDPKLMRQALTNLLFNAVKYSPEGGVVELTIAYLQQEVSITIRDEGIGIVEVDSTLLFEPFHRGTNVGSIPGTGLGLAIVKRAVDLQGGTIQVKSNIGAGTIFTLTFPL